MKQRQDRFYEQQGVAMTCRSFAEYTAMFGLEESGLAGMSPLLDAGGGASSFAAEAARKGFAVRAADPMYGLEPDVIEETGRREIEVSTAKLAGLADRYRWDYYGDLQNHRAGREKSLELFLRDFRSAEGKGERYVEAGLPHLPFADDTFGLVLCSHFLFLYHEQFDLEFHRAAVLELLRVCRPGGEVRIYPLLTFRTERYPHLQAVKDAVRAAGGRPEELPSGLPFIPNSTHLLRIRKGGEGLV